jgi:hypothetical protein
MTIKVKPAAANPLTRVPNDLAAAPVKVIGAVLVPLACWRGVEVAIAAEVVVRVESGTDVEVIARGVVVRMGILVITPIVSVVNEILIMVVSNKSVKRESRMRRERAYIATVSSSFSPGVCPGVCATFGRG